MKTLSYRLLWLIFGIICLSHIASPVAYAQKQYTANDAIKGITSKSSKNKKNSKKSKKAGPIGKGFQDLTARFNRYFNANLRYTEGIQQLASGKKDDYTQLLPVYAYKGGDGSAIGANLEAAIKKTSIVIQKKPNSKWVDNSYLLLGKSYYLKGDYESAEESFQYIINNFSFNIRKSYDRVSNAQLKKLREKERAETRKSKEKEKEEKLKQQEEAKKIREEEKEKQQKEREKAQKDKKKQQEDEREAREEERQQQQKEREKDRKEELKEREKTKKEQLKEREKQQKERKKEQERRKKEREREIKERKKSGTKASPKPKKEETETNNNKENEETNTENPKPKKETPTEKRAREKQEKEAKEAAKKEAELREAEKDKWREEEKAKEEAEKKEQEEEEAAEAKKADTSVVISRKGNEKIYKSGGIGHKLSKHDAMVWLARTYIDNQKMNEAGAVIDIIAQDKTFPKKLKGDFNLLKAHYYLQSSQWSNAKTALQVAAKSTPKRKGRARLYYVLAQLEEQEMNYKEAVEAYAKVLKSKPNYEMEFNARLSMIKTKMNSGEYDADKAIAKLEKMTKDGKNTDYLDQIYFTMSEIAAQSGNEALAQEYLSKSASKSTQNPAQKALAMLRLADINYEKEKYELASAYYDTTLVGLPKSHKDFGKVKTRQEVLGKLVQYLNTVALQDSLQRIAKMPEKERNQFIDNLIAQLAEEARAKQEEEQRKLLEATNNPNAANNSAGQWYFYNTTAKSQGYTEFIGRWGNRPLADNWRLSSKLSGNLASNADTTETRRAELVEMALQGTLTRDLFLEKLPLSPQALHASDSLILEALYAAGGIYRVSLENDAKAIQIFEDLLRRFPNNEHDQQINYQLYLLYSKTGNTKKAQAAREYILQKYPDSVFAKLLQDPEYAKKLASASSEQELYYNETYRFFESEQYETVLKRVFDADSLFAENEFKPKFDLLSAFAIGKLQDKAAYMNALQTIIVKYPNNEVKVKAQEILNFLETNTNQSTGTPTITSDVSNIYRYEPNGKHYVVLALDAYSQQVNELSNKLSNFNTTNFASEQLKVNQMLLDAEKQVVLIKEFPNADKAMIYYRGFIQQQNQALSGLDLGTTFKVFVISKTNFTQYFKNKDTNAYMGFFEEKYPK